MSRAAPLLELVRLQLLSVARDRMSTFWTLVFPIVLLLIFGSVYAGGGGEEKLMIYGAAADQWGRDLLKALERFNVTVNPVEPPANPERYVAEQSLRLRRPVTLLVAGGNNVTIYSTSAVEASIVGGIIYGVMSPPVGELHVEMKVVGGSGEVGRMGPALVALVLLLAIALQTGVVAVPLTFADLYISGLLKRLVLSPLGRVGLVAVAVVANALFSIASTVTLFVVGSAVYRIDLSMLASAVPWAAFAVVYLFGVGLGLLLYTMWAVYGERDVSTMTPILLSTFLGLAFLSGMFMPYELLPAGVRAVMQYFPTTHAALILRAYQAGYVDPAAFLYPAAASLAVFAVGAALFRPLKRP